MLKKVNPVRDNEAYHVRNASQYLEEINMYRKGLTLVEMMITTALDGVKMVFQVENVETLLRVSGEVAPVVLTIPVAHVISVLMKPHILNKACFLQEALKR